jgi:predicted secreted acid phosphatase
MQKLGRPSGHRRNTLLIAASTAAVLFSTPGLAGAAPADPADLAPHSTFTMQADGSSGLTATGAEIPNIDSDKATIRTYYNADKNGIANKSTSPYITEMNQIEQAILAAAPNPAPAPNLAIVFDADDTTLMTYDMEDGAMHFNFDPALQNQWVQNRLFPATPGMVNVVNTLAARGYNIFGITGRTDDQEAATLQNLQDVGYTAFNADNFFTKYKTTPKPDYLDCNSGVDPDDPAKCTTVEYKAGTRKHIQDDLGMTIVGNIGDQFSDLQGGYAARTVKLPNPTYYLPSPDIKGAPASDAQLTPRTQFTMAPDGSSGASEGGEGIPNIDSVKATIRTYYGATNGIANKDASPYISEMRGIAATWAGQVKDRCARAIRHGKVPAVVFDADDTTLWTYDMEDAAMKFNFDPTLQNTWVQEERFPATPGMQRVVRAAHNAHCKIVGLTGRNNAQRTATLDNLAKYYYDKKTDLPLFRSQYYFTKWTSTDTPPAYVNCAMDSDPTKCSTIEYKASTRKYVRQHFGFKIVANFGDQFSDLIGGYGPPVKLPNPTYYLP